MKHVLFAIAVAASFAAGAADDRFDKKSPDSMMGFLPARDPAYVKECGSCHFPYSPGLMPARSWVRQLDRMEKHFGESVKLSPEVRAQLQDYLTKNAADVSQYEGSKAFMERVPQGQTPYRLADVFLFRQMHTVIAEVIQIKPKVKVKTLANCNACHTNAVAGSFANEELYVPGLTRAPRVMPTS